MPIEEKIVYFESREDSGIKLTVFGKIREIISNQDKQPYLILI